MKGWVGLVGWPVADGIPTLVVTHQLQVERRTWKVHQSVTDVLPLSYATNCVTICATLFASSDVTVYFRRCSLITGRERPHCYTCCPLRMTLSLSTTRVQNNFTRSVQFSSWAANKALCMLELPCLYGTNWSLRCSSDVRDGSLIISFLKSRKYKFLKCVNTPVLHAISTPTNFAAESIHLYRASCSTYCRLLIRLQWAKGKKVAADAAAKIPTISFCSKPCIRSDRK